MGLLAIYIYVYIYIIWRFPEMEVPPKTLDGLFHRKSIYKWMMTGGTPMDWKPPFGVILFFHSCLEL